MHSGFSLAYLVNTLQNFRRKKGTVYSLFNHVDRVEYHEYNNGNGNTTKGGKTRNELDDRGDLRLHVFMSSPFAHCSLRERSLFTWIVIL